MSEQGWRREWDERVTNAGLMPRPTHRDHYRAVLVSVPIILAADAALTAAEREVVRLREIERRVGMYLTALDVDRAEQRLRSLDDLEVQETVLRGAVRAAQEARRG